MLALYLALSLDLPRPYWAMATVYVVSNPFLGPGRSKSVYRVVGTVIGAGIAVLLVPPLANVPLILCVLVVLWVAVLLFLSMSDRTARGYAFLLAGYTTLLIVLPASIDPTSVFEVAVSRTEEVVLGIVCAGVVGAVVFPRQLAPAVIDSVDSWFDDAILYTSEALSGTADEQKVYASLQRLAATVHRLELGISQMSYDHVTSSVVERMETLRRRMKLFLPIVVSLADAHRALVKESSPALDGLDRLVHDVLVWMRASVTEGKSSQVLSGIASGTWKQRLREAKPSQEEFANWRGALRSDVLWRLDQITDIWHDCVSLRAGVWDKSANWEPRLDHWLAEKNDRYFDNVSMLLSLISAVGAIAVVGVFWIEARWVDGSTAVMLAAIACGLFAALDEPVPHVYRFFLAILASTVLAGVYLFVALPHVQGFLPLAVLFAGPFIFIGAFIPGPTFGVTAMLVAVFTARFTSIQSVYDANFEEFLNSSLAGVAGAFFAVVWTKVTRPFGSEFIMARILRSIWFNVSIASRPIAAKKRREVLPKILDQVVQLIQRIHPAGAQSYFSVESLRDLQIALVSSDLCNVRDVLDDGLSQQVEDVLWKVSAYYSSCAQIGFRQIVPVDTLSKIDSVLKIFMSRSVNMHDNRRGRAAGPHAMESNISDIRDATRALIGLRLSLPSGPYRGSASLI
ncbi:Uncharacterized membrane protein YccC [Paraburkholderia lycopersici]|uniref:Uncharacterized membrane protein YccC n=2 Tax=Paraburkholderia lycopersici TaxID=416944 RepID=A0A1G7A0V4_9BURK|nr:Uncharacterized membrane protein YccC [Paraburkholderia lycopersici]